VHDTATIAMQAAGAALQSWVRAHRISYAFVQDQFMPCPQHALIAPLLAAALQRAQAVRSAEAAMGQGDWLTSAHVCCAALAAATATAGAAATAGTTASATAGAATSVQLLSPEEKALRAEIHRLYGLCCDR
jgi:hypothetical protein